MSTVRGPGAAPGRSNVTAQQSQATTTHTPAATTPADTTAQAPAPAPKKDGYAQSPDVSGRQRVIGSDAQITGETPTVQANPALQGDVSAARASAQAATRQASKTEVHGHSHDHEHHTHGKGGGGKTDLGDACLGNASLQSCACTWLWRYPLDTAWPRGLRRSARPWRGVPRRRWRPKTPRQAASGPSPCPPS